MEMKKPDVRFLYQLKSVLYDRQWLKSARNFPVYYMYRGVKSRNGLRYDITRIPAKMLGREFVKTKGHEHSNRYGEIYQVLKGRAIYLLQKRKGNKIKDVYAVKAKAKEFVVIPPLYGHVTINPGPRELKEGNWVDKRCKNIYNFFEKKQGACYYFTKTGWIKNGKYERAPRLKFKKPLKKCPKIWIF
jgi:glucose-6-phosphate isomerase